MTQYDFLLVAYRDLLALMIWKHNLIDKWLSYILNERIVLKWKINASTS